MKFEYEKPDLMDLNRSGLLVRGGSDCTDTITENPVGCQCAGQPLDD